MNHRITLLFLFATGCCSLYAGATRAVIQNPSGKTTIYYRGGKEVARETVDTRGRRRVQGRVPQEDLDGDIPARPRNAADRYTGVMKDYYGDGALKAEITVREGKMDGVSRLYYKTGKLQEEISCRADILEGISRQYYENGALSAEISYRNGRKDGALKMYDKKNPRTPAYEYIYRNGEIIGSRSYDDRGNLEFSADFLNESHSSAAGR